MRKECAYCGGPFEAKRHLAKYCSSAHRQRAYRESAAADAVTLRGSSPDGSVVTVARTELERAGRMDSSLGQLVLTLARRLDLSDGDSAASLAALAKEYRASMAEALKGAGAVADPLDELRNARERKRATG